MLFSSVEDDISEGHEHFFVYSINSVELIGTHLHLHWVILPERNMNVLNMLHLIVF